jgi:hypothetical protein
MPFQHLGASSFDASAQDRLEAGLRDEQPPAGAHRVHSLIEAWDYVGELSTRKRVHNDERALGLELLQ